MAIASIPTVEKSFAIAATNNFVPTPSTQTEEYFPG